jgi:hypothetical protein
MLRNDLRTNIAVAFLLGIAAVLVSYLAFSFLLNFNLGLAYRRAIENHIAWRDTPDLIGPLLAAQNLIEMARWTGLPTAIMYVGCCCEIAGRVVRWRRLLPLDLFTLSYPVVLVTISIFGHTIAEAGRLWIPMMIPLFIPVAVKLDALYGKRIPWVYLVSSFVMILLVKNFHDFQ